MQIGEPCSTLPPPNRPPAPPDPTDDPRPFVVLELYDVDLVDGTLRVEGLAEPLELNVADCGANGDYVFVLPGCQEATSCRATLSFEGREHVLFDGVDLKAAAEALTPTDGQAPEPFDVQWPDEAFVREEPSHRPSRAGRASDMFVVPRDASEVRPAADDPIRLEIVTVHAEGDN